MEGEVCRRCGCGPFLRPLKDHVCIHCIEPTHLATHRQHSYTGSHAFVQWKNTEVCMDFYCMKCGSQDHIDDTFVYFIKCANCGTTYMTGWYVDMVELTEEEAASVASKAKIVNEADDDGAS